MTTQIEQHAAPADSNFSNLQESMKSNNKYATKLLSIKTQHKIAEHWPKQETQNRELGELNMKNQKIMLLSAPNFSHHIKFLTDPTV